MPKADLKRTQRIRERIVRNAQFKVAIATLERVLGNSGDPKEKKPETDLPMLTVPPSNLPKGMRVVDYNAVREAQILSETYEQIRRGSCTRASREDSVPSTRAAKKRERTAKAAKERATKYRARAAKKKTKREQDGKQHIQP